MKSSRIGIIGCGKQAAKHISSLKKMPGLDLVLTDINTDTAKDLASKSGASWLSHPDEIFEDNNIQAIIISTPTQSHVSLIKKAIESKKDVFCEKPLSESIEETKGLKDLISNSNRIVLIGYVYRYVPIFEEGYKIFKEQQKNGNSLIMGKPFSAFFRLGGRGGHRLWKHQKATGGGAINEMLVHMIDLANWYFGPLQDIEVISCDLRYPERIIQGEKVCVDAEDYILVKCIGKNGVEIFCQGDLITPAFSQYVEIQSENGTFMGSIQDDITSYVFLKEDRGGFNVGKTVLQYGRRNVLDLQMMYFILSVLKNDFPDRNTIEDSLELMSIMDEIKKQTS